MGISDERAPRAEDGAIQLQKMVARAKEMKDRGCLNSEIAAAMGITENYVRNLVPSETNPGYNCLTIGVHHGRPEAIWNLPLLQATMMFGTDGLKQLVVARIHSDATELLGREMGKTLAAAAEQGFDELLDRKMTELIQYYESASWRTDVTSVIEWYKEGKLSSHYQPLHSHDSINMICRILAQGNLPKLARTEMGS